VYAGSFWYYLCAAKGRTPIFSERGLSGFLVSAAADGLGSQTYNNVFGTTLNSFMIPTPRKTWFADSIN
jgi:hypothetical protein